MHNNLEQTHYSKARYILRVHHRMLTMLLSDYAVLRKMQEFNYHYNELTQTWERNHNA
jgi:hypothetical protein